MSEARPRNMSTTAYIKASGAGVGQITLLVCARDSVYDGLIVCEGQRVSVRDLPDLYVVIGDTFCPKEIVTYLPRPLWKRLLMKVGFYFKPNTVKNPNPDYVHGFFRVPDFRSGLI